MTAESDPGGTRGPAGSSRWRWLRVPAYGAVVASAIVVAWLMTRGEGAAPEGAAHDHATMAGARGDSAQPVSLSAEQSRRIGVTFAVATVGPLGREVRTVGQVTADETRLQAISPKFDGWVERLYVNTTGQPVTRGAPLLTIYSPMLVQAQEELLLARALQREMGGASA